MACKHKRSFACCYSRLCVLQNRIELITELKFGREL